MALELIEEVSSPKISPPPIKDKIISNDLPTIVFIRYLQDLRNSGGDIFKELNKVIKQVNLNIEEINALQEELDTTQKGAGLNTDGTYIKPTGTNFIDTSISLAQATLFLDTALGNTQVKVIPIDADYQATNINQMLLVDAASGLTTITLPNPTTFIVNNTSNTIGITKIDTLDSIISIIPNDGELIIGETAQELRHEGDVLNFITDGTNWYLNN